MSFAINKKQDTTRPLRVVKRVGRENSKRGFTLVEIITAVSLFLIVMTISMGSIISVFEADRKSKSLRSIMGNLNLALESMAREMRFGENYHCGSTGALTTPANCPSGSSFVSFLSSDNEQVVYRMSNSSVEKSVNGGSSYTVVTAPEVTIDDLDFYVLGAGTSNTLQPKILIKVKGTAGSGSNQTDFTLQTLVSQRALDK